MIIPVCIDDDELLNVKDEQKLVEIENKKNIIYETVSNYSDLKVIDSKIGRLLLFDTSYQGGIINYIGYTGGMPYTRYLNLAKILNNNIKSILILGLGVGTNIKESIELYDPDCIDVVEIDQEVANISKEFFDISCSDKVNIIVDDAKDYVFNTKKKYDLILVDIFFASGMPLELMKIDFIKKLSEIITEEGIVAANLFGLEDISGDSSCIFKSQYKSYTSCFDNLYVFPVLYGAYEFYRCACNLRYKMSEFTNIVLIATKSGHFIDKKTFIEKAKAIQNNLKAPFMRNYSLYARDYYEQQINTDHLKIFDETFPEGIKNNQQTIAEYLYNSASKKVY